MGQTGRSFAVNFQENLLSLNNNYKSEFSEHVLDNGYCFGKIEGMKVVFYYKKERRIYTAENSIFTVRQQGEIKQRTH